MILESFRSKLLEGESGVTTFPVRNMGDLPAGVCNFEQTKYQKRKEVRIGTRAGGIGIYCAHEAIKNAGLSLEEIDPSKVGYILALPNTEMLRRKPKFANYLTIMMKK